MEKNRNFVSKSIEGIEGIVIDGVIRIDPRSEGFFDRVTEFMSVVDVESPYNFYRRELQQFKDAISEVSQNPPGAFWKPTVDPSVNEGNRVVFEKGRTPLTGQSYDWWFWKATDLKKTTGVQWKLGDEYEYYSFLVWLINALVDQGWSIKDAVYGICIKSNELGMYRDSPNPTKELACTGSYEVCGVCDLANTCKILGCRGGGYWIASGEYCFASNNAPLASLNHSSGVGFVEGSCGWLIISDN